MASTLITEPWQVEYDGVLFGTESGLEIVSMDLFTSPTIRTNDTARPQAHGNYLGDDWYGARNFSMEIEVWGYSAVDLQQRIKKVLGATALKEQPLPMYVRIDGKEELVLFARPIQRSNVLDIETVVGHVARFSVRWRADDPRLYTAEENVNVMSLQAAAFGGQFDAQFDYTFGGASVTGSAILYNVGNIQSFPVVTINGPVTNPALRVIDAQGEETLLSINGTIDSNDELVLDMSARTITLNGASAYDRLNDPNSWFTLLPGNNTVTFTGITPPGEMPTATVTWRSASV